MGPRFSMLLSNALKASVALIGVCRLLLAQGLVCAVATWFYPPHNCPLFAQLISHAFVFCAWLVLKQQP
jgi:hypothetical protein